MSSNEEVAAAIEAAKATGLPICATMTFGTASRSMMGVMPADFAEFAKRLGAYFIGANCGIPVYVEGAIHYHGTPELMAEYALFARDAGAKIRGGAVVLVRHIWRQWLLRLRKLGWMLTSITSVGITGESGVIVSAKREYIL